MVWLNLNCFTALLHIKWSIMVFMAGGLNYELYRDLKELRSISGYTLCRSRKHQY